MGARLSDEPVVAPHLLPVEVANILRRNAITRLISADAAALAHSDLLRMRVALHAYAPFARRVWDLRSNVTAYDAWYVAVAEAFDCHWPPSTTGWLGPLDPAASSCFQLSRADHKVRARAATRHAPGYSGRGRRGGRHWLDLTL